MYQFIITRDNPIVTKVQTLLGLNCYHEEGGEDILCGGAKVKVEICQNAF